MTNPDSRSSIHVYNLRCALTVEPSRNRRGDVHTVNLEAASRTTDRGDFDWERKVVVQVTDRELPDVVAVLLSRLPAVEFLYHGPARDKGYRLFHDGDRLVVQIFAGGRERHTVTLSRADRLRLSTTLFRQLQKNHGGLSAEVLHAMLVQIYSPPTGQASSPTRSDGDRLRDTPPTARPPDDALPGNRRAVPDSAGRAGDTKRSVMERPADPAEHDAERPGSDAERRIDPYDW